MTVPHQDLATPRQGIPQPGSPAGPDAEPLHRRRQRSNRYQ